MARIRWNGQEFYADPVRKLPNGDWIMRAKQHGPRFTIGTEIAVAPNEIVEMASAEMPEDPQAAARSLADLDRAMAEERKTLTPVAELLAKAPKTVVRKPEPGDA